MKFSREMAKTIREHAGIKPMTPALWNNNQADKPESKKRRKKYTEQAKASRSTGEMLFDELCQSHGLPIPEHEYPFAPWEGGTPGCLHPKGEYKCKTCGARRRRWRFDYLFDGWLAVEKQGGNFVGGKHSNPGRLRDEYEKHRHAVLNGYAILPFLPEEFEDGSAFEFIKRVLGSEAAQP